MEQTSDSKLPDTYDRQLASLHDLPDVVRTKPSTVRTVPPLGIGGSQVYIVQTYRQRERGDTIFLEVMGSDGATRVVLPPAVTSIIARHRDALTGRTRSQAAKAVAEDRKRQGIQPGFMQSKKLKTKP